MVIESLLIGLVVGYIFYELFEISPGGVVTPGYFALFINQPERILVTFLIAILVWLIIEFLQKHLILYGKRKFLLALLLGFLIKLIFEYYIQPSGLTGFDLLSIGYIIPGLIANEMLRQNFFKTISATLIVTVLVYFILLLIH